ncbi:rhodanese-like domain-containing protein [Micromonospora siamensis]|uniref:Rhodanese-related sulfurtransferase n=1 Tax=Micromonospora siamensis TaxID=299152 RepID=A0A1C5J4Q9_9ACTN|nr:rhodanese-like domain-containing protein [Micromonospora siamensis]SCG65535.1 Rhodanese-related sulfurtransferase [Micromonospora siamensis]
MREVDLTAFATAHARGATVVDVREPAEYVTGHVPGARCIPLGHLTANLGDVPRGDTVYVVCASGNRSKVGADVLERAGFDARSVAGGTAAWSRAGHPVTQGTRA